MKPKILISLVFPCPKVAAQTGHKVTLVDISQDVLDKSAGRIGESIKRVAKKQHKDDQVQQLPWRLARFAITLI